MRRITSVDELRGVSERIAERMRFASIKSSIRGEEQLESLIYELGCVDGVEESRVRRGGYWLRQSPKEFAEVLWFLKRLRKFERLLEIGAAAGGSARLLKDFLGLKEVFVVDDNGSYESRFRKELLPEAVEWVGNSHSKECADQLRKWGKKFDLVHIDADHSYEGVKQDAMLVLPWLEEGAVLIFHDILGWEGVRRFWNEILAGMYSYFEVLKEVKIWTGSGIVRFRSV